MIINLWPKVISGLLYSASQGSTKFVPYCALLCFTIDGFQFYLYPSQVTFLDYVTPSLIGRAHARTDPWLQGYFF